MLGISWTRTFPTLITLPASDSFTLPIKPQYFIPHVRRMGDISYDRPTFAIWQQAWRDIWNMVELGPKPVIARQPSTHICRRICFQSPMTCPQRTAWNHAIVATSNPVAHWCPEAITIVELNTKPQMLWQGGRSYEAPATTTMAAAYFQIAFSIF